MKEKVQRLFRVSNMKNIMSLDERVGRISPATPLVFSMAVELFIQDLCDRTYDVTLRKGAKSMSLQHLKECIHTHPMFDFLKDVVSHVPDEPQTEGNTGLLRKAVKGNKVDNGRKKKANKQATAEASGNKGLRRGRDGQKYNSEELKSAAPGKLDDDNETAPLLHHKDGTYKTQGNESEQWLKPEDIRHIMQDKVFDDEDYDCEDE